MSLATVVIVEDQLLTRNILRRFLQPVFPGWKFIEAIDGASAMEACGVYRPDVVLMDIFLPDTNGIALVKRLKPLLPDAKVIFVSYMNEETLVDRAIAAGGCAYVVKDRLFTDLIPAIRNAVGGQQSAAGTY